MDENWKRTKIVLYQGENKRKADWSGMTVWCTGVPGYLSYGHEQKPSIGCFKVSHSIRAGRLRIVSDVDLEAVDS